MLRSIRRGSRCLGGRVVVYGGGNTAIDVARTDASAPGEAVIVYRARASACRRTTSRSRRRCEEGVLVKWLSTIEQAGDAGAIDVEKMVLDAEGLPQPTGEFETRRPTQLVLALGQDVDLSLLDGVPGLVMKDGVVQVDPTTMMTGRPRHVRRRRHGAGRSATSRWRWARQEGGAPRRRLAARRRARDRAAKHAPATFERLNTWVLQRRAEDRAPSSTSCAAHEQLRRGQARPDRGQRAVRGAALPVVRQLLRMRQLLRRLPRQRRGQARPGQTIRLHLRLP